MFEFVWEIEVRGEINSFVWESMERRGGGVWVRVFELSGMIFGGLG